MTFLFPWTLKQKKPKNDHINLYLFKALGGNTGTKFKVNTRDTRMMFIDAVLTPFINFEPISELALVFLILALNRQMVDVIICKFILF